jgi:hypothetical protein
MYQNLQLKSKLPKIVAPLQLGRCFSYQNRHLELKLLHIVSLPLRPDGGKTEASFGVTHAGFSSPELQVWNEGPNRRKAA